MINHSGFNRVFPYFIVELRTRQRGRNVPFGPRRRNDPLPVQGTAPVRPGADIWIVKVDCSDCFALKSSCSLVPRFFFRLYEIDENMYDLPELDNPESERLRTFTNWLNSSKPYPASIRVVR